MTALSMNHFWNPTVQQDKKHIVRYAEPADAKFAVRLSL